MEGSGDQPALSKAYFADHVQADVKEYSHFDFSGFKPLIELIEAVLEDVAEN